MHKHGKTSTATAMGVPENMKDASRNTAPDGIHHTILTAGKDKHSQLRRLLSNAFSEKSLKE
jgi:cytochrome P450